jgi:hypothetical protein
MSISVSAAGRDAAGRFLPGQSGNPDGKRPGTRNRATRLRELIADGEERVIGRVLIDKAKAGDAVAARFVLSHLMPAPRGRAIELDIPEATWPGDVVAVFNATMLAMTSGEITPDEALTITRTFDGRLKALKAWETERYMTRWEGIPGDVAFEEQEDEAEEHAPATAPTEPSPCGRGQGEGAAPANALHLGEHPDPLPMGEGAAPTEPSPLGRGQGEGAAPAKDLHCGAHPHPDPLPEGEGVEAIAPVAPPSAEPPPRPCIPPASSPRRRRSRGGGASRSRRCGNGRARCPAEAYRLPVERVCPMIPGKTTARDRTGRQSNRRGTRCVA